MSEPSDEPRWLDDRERTAWLTLAAVTVKLPAALDARLQRDANLSTFEYVVMAMLSEEPTRTLRMSDLAAVTNGSLSRLSHVVKRLERQGFVRREPDPKDGRFTHAILTPGGWEKVVAAAPGHVAAVRELVLDALTPAQLREVQAVGDAVLARLDAEPTSTWVRPPGCS